ncbi:hypothetical protein D3C84_1039440 [compost metagenome]
MSDSWTRSAQRGVPTQSVATISTPPRIALALIRLWPELCMPLSPAVPVIPARPPRAPESPPRRGVDFQPHLRKIKESPNASRFPLDEEPS